jgi:ABC-type Na+ efflux pump permease subunit
VNAVWLIAGREFRAYVATASFWLALMVGPAVMAAGLLLIGTGPKAGPPPASLTLTRGPGGAAEARFSPGFPLSADGKARVLAIIDRDAALRGPVREITAATKPAIDARAISRFVLAMMLWMTLTGSLGMLLQAVVRERSNRALESLLASAGPLNLVFGKLIGVGGVSALIVAAWLGSSAFMIALSVQAGGRAGALLQSIAHPAALAPATGVYLLAYAFYGLTTVAIGARARDNADAQNLARPMFAVLLMVFFATMTASGGAARGLGWLVFLPPFTPFMLLVQPRPPEVELAAIALLVAATVCAGVLAVRATTLDGAASRRPRLRPAH